MHLPPWAFYMETVTVEPLLFVQGETYMTFKHQSYTYFTPRKNKTNKQTNKQ